MKLNEIIAHNKSSIEQCSDKQIEWIHNNIHSLREDENTKFLFKSCQKFGGWIHDKNTGWSYDPSKVCKYVCTCLCWNKDLDTFCGFVQFGFNNRNRLHSSLQEAQKNNNNIVCYIISVHEDVKNGGKHGCIKR